MKPSPSSRGPASFGSILFLVFSVSVFLLTLAFFWGGNDSPFSSAARNIADLITSLRPGNKLFVISTATKPSFLLSIPDPRLDSEASNPILFRTRNGQTTAEQYLIHPLMSRWFYHILKDRCAENGELVVDVGANLGYFSLYAAKLGCNVVNFEPQPKPIALMKQSMVLNRIPPSQIAIYQHYIASLPRIIRFNRDNLDFWGKSVELPPNQQQEFDKPYLEVKSVRLDEIIEQNTKILLLKIDTGIYAADFDALESARSLIEHGLIENIHVQFDCSPEARKLWIWLKSHGFEPFIVLEEYDRFLSEEEWSEEYNKNFVHSTPTIADIKRLAGKENPLVEVWFKRTAE